MNGDWKLLGRPAPGELQDARLQLHHAAQIVSAVGSTYLEARPDDSQPNMGWNAQQGALAGHFVEAPRRFQAALRLADLTLLLLDESGNTMGRKPLGGCSWEEGRQWLAQIIGSAVGASKQLQPPGYELPSHPVEQGQAFSLQPVEAFRELSRWYANADMVLREVESLYPQASEVRCWPHHFDIAILLILDPDEPDWDKARSVGVGMTPGDHDYPSPYWYVNHGPEPEDPAWPALAGGGYWHTEGWRGAVLTAERLVSTATAEGQAKQVRDFLRSAMEGSFRLIGWD